MARGFLPTLAGIGAGLLAFLVAGELAFRVLPVSSATNAGYHVDPALLTYAPSHSWRYATGWDLRNPQSLVTNAQGFVSDHDFKPDPQAVALIGDSYIESASLDAADRPAAQLERLLGGSRKVYAMGNAGTSLLDYAERVRWGAQQFGIRDFVLFLERGDVLQSLCGSGNIASQCLQPGSFEPRTEKAGEASALKRVARESAFAQYIASQLKLNPGDLWRGLWQRDVPDLHAAAAAAPAARGPKPAPAAIEAVTRTFFERVGPHIKGRLVIVVDADREALQKHRNPADPNRQQFIELARAAGAVVVDTEPAVRRHFAASKRSLDIGPYDGHLNPLGAALVAREAAAALQR